MTFISSNVVCEGNLNTLNYRSGLTEVAVSASTYTLSLASTSNIIFYGSTAGQIINLGNASNYLVGQEWWIYNKSTTFISIRNFSSVEILQIPPESIALAKLRTNGTSNGVWLIMENLEGQVVGGLLNALFSSTANSVSNKFLDTENIASSYTLPAVAVTSALLQAISFTNTSASASGTLELRINTTTGTPAVSAVVTARSQVFSISVPVFAGDKLNMKVAAGASNISKPLVKVYA